MCERDNDGHADSFWAWALANYAVVEGKEKKPGFYQQVKAKKETAASKETNGTGPVSSVKARGKSLTSLMRNWDRRGADG